MSHFNKNGEDFIQNIILVNGLTYVAKTLHDSITAMTFEDEKRQISELILAFIRRVNYGRDFEEQLNFYVTCRGSFSNLDTVLQFLVQAACQLIMRVHKIIKGAHTRKTAAFVRAAVGYCYITIPSIVNIMPRLSLYLLAGQVALLNECVPQAEATFKAAVTLISEISSMPDLDPSFGGNKNGINQDIAMLNYLRKFFAILIAVPGHPEAGPFFLLKGLLNALQNYQWFDPDNKVPMYIGVLELLCNIRQNNLPFTIANVQLNDILYNGDDRYYMEIDGIASTVVKEVVTHLTGMVNPQKKGELSLQLFNVFISFCQIPDKETLSYLSNLYFSAKKGIPSNPYLKSTMDHVSEKAKTSNIYQVLLKTMVAA